MGIQHMCRYIFPLITTKYVAFCDGDDYWIDPLKLQKQYDFLESHKAYGACYAQTKRYYEDTGNFGGLQGSEVNSFEMLLEECTITWQTFFMRNHLLQEYIQVIKPEVLHTDWCVQDYPLELYTMKSSRIYFMEEPMAVFRIYKNSVTHQTNLPRLLHYATGILNIISYYSENINAEKADRIKAKYTSYFMGILIRDKHTCKVGRNLKLFMRVGGIYYVDAFLLLLASSLFWFPIAVRGLYFIKRKIMPVKWR